MKTKLEIVYSDGGVETDYSKEAMDFKRDTFDITLTTDDFIYIGYRKPINALYVAMTAVNTVTSSLSFEYYSDAGWAALEVCDDTNAFTRNGFITWDRPANQANITIAGTEACWIRLAANDDLSLVTFQAINLIFADDNDMCDEVPALIDPCFYVSGQTSHLLQHVATKQYIMNRLKARGYIKTTPSGLANIDEWDILDIHELKLAATYYSISQIYFNLSDDIEDQYWVKYQEYKAKFDEALGAGLLQIDLDDDGVADVSEKRPVRTVRWER
jgi:hypothetical protein